MPHDKQVPVLHPVRTSEPSLQLLLDSDFDRRREQKDFNPANFTFDIPNTPDITQITKILPSFVSIPNLFLVSQPKTVYIALDGSAGGNLVNAADGNAYEIVCPLDITGTSAGNNAIFRPSDLFLWDIDYHTPRDFSRITVRLLDDNLNQLTLQQGTNVTIILKCFHRALKR